MLMSEALLGQLGATETELLKRPGGAEWAMIRFDQGFLLLTSAGRELLRDTEIDQQVEQYQRALAANNVGVPALAGTVTPPRSYVGEGTRAKVFTLGDKFAVKETYPHHPPLYTVLTTMDRLYDVIKERTPGWLDMPEHYGALHIKHHPTEYLLMQHTANGVTVGDFADFLGKTQEAQSRLISIFGNPSDWYQEVMERYDETKSILSDALKRARLKPGKYMDDWHNGNVLVEPLDEPIDGSNIRLWVIDQYLPPRYHFVDGDMVSPSGMSFS